MEFPLALGLEKAGLPFIVTMGKLQNICFLIDTGSTHNIIYDFVYEHIKDSVRLIGEKQRTIGMDGIYKESFTIEATFNFEDEDYTSTFSVLEANAAVSIVQEESGIQMHGVLGIPFLVQNKWIVDFDKCVVYKHNK